MSMTYSQLSALIEEITPNVQGYHVLKCKEFENRMFLLILESKEGRREKLLFCFQNPFLRIHLCQGKIEKKEISSSFGKTLQNYLETSLLISLNICNEDRIVNLEFSKKGIAYHLILELFPKKPNCFLLDPQSHILASLNPDARIHKYCYPKKPLQSLPFHREPLIKTASMNRFIEEHYRQQESLLRFEEDKSKIKQRIGRLLKQREKRLSHLQAEISRCLEWKQRQYEAELLKTYAYQIPKGSDTVTLEDVSDKTKKLVLTLDPRLSIGEEISLRFSQAKNLKIGLSFAEKLKNEQQEHLTHLKELEKSIESISSQEELAPYFSFITKDKPAKQKSQSKTKRDKNSGFLEYETASRLKLYVGKSAEANEKITFSFAKGNDYWFHVAESPGSHVILKTGKSKEVDQESILDAIQLALHYSKVKNQKCVKVLMTQRKFVSKLGKKGQVQISKHKEYDACPDENRFRKLKERKQNGLVEKIPF